ncbi:MAG TPA: sulfatase-like hydrolase/transferase [Planctomycetaceae bacterium]
MKGARILSSVIWGGIAVACGVSIRPGKSAEQRLNLILITLDTTRADHLGCYGYRGALTPTLDGLAEHGVLFERAYTPVPLTLPAHASMHTGLYPFEHGIFTNGNHGLPTEIPTLAEVLAERGYATGAFIASFVLNRVFGLDRGFETYDDDVDAPPTVEPAGDRKRSADQVIDRALAWLTAQLTTQLTAHETKPFFCWVHLFDPHAEYLDHRETFGDRFREHPYDAEIAFVDAQLKRLMEFLDARHLTERTIVIVAGDHGEGLTEHREHWHGYMLYDSTLRVPLIISGPQIRGGRRVAEPASLVDLVPTALDLLDIPCPAATGDRSLKPAMSGEHCSPKACYGVAQEAFLEEGWSPLSCLITTEWKYIQTTIPELYDLQNDPGETMNLAELRPDKLLELQRQLYELEATGVRRASPAVNLSERERGNLASLGYSSAPNRKESHKSPPDIKDMVDRFAAFQSAREMCLRGESESAIAPLYELIFSAPRYIAPRLLLAQLLKSRGKLEEAETQFRAILDVDPDHEETHENLGNLYASRGQYELALTHLLEALDDSPLSVSLHKNTGEVMNALGRRREAVAHFQAAEELWNRQHRRSQQRRR